MDVVKENNMAVSLSVSSNTGYIDFSFSARNDVKEDTLPPAKIKILIKTNLVLLDDTENGYLTWRNLQLNHMLHVVTLKDTNSLIQMS